MRSPRFFREESHGHGGERPFQLHAIQVGQISYRWREGREGGNDSGLGEREKKKKKGIFPVFAHKGISFHSGRSLFRVEYQEASIRTHSR